MSIAEKFSTGEGPEKNGLSCAGVETPMLRTATSQSPVPNSAPWSATAVMPASVTRAPAVSHCCCASSIAGASAETPASVGKMTLRLGALLESTERAAAGL